MTVETMAVAPLHYRSFHGLAGGTRMHGQITWALPYRDAKQLYRIKVVSANKESCSTRSLLNCRLSDCSFVIGVIYEWCK